MLHCDNNPNLKISIHRKLFYLECENCSNYNKIGIHNIKTYKKFLKWYDKIILLAKYKLLQTIVKFH